MIDWDKFAERVPAGTRIIGSVPHTDSAIEGILLENKPFKDWEFPSGDLNDPFKPIHPTRVHVQFFVLGNYTQYGYVEGLVYFINGQWLTFDEVMT